MLKIAICDDNITFTGEIEKLLYQEAYRMLTGIEIDVFFDGSSLEKTIKKGNHYELVYLDIKMEKMNGISAAHHIRELDKSVLFIFISSYEQYLKELFEVEPFRYLSKPLDKKLFAQYFKDACLRIGENSAYYQYKYNKQIFKVPLKNVIYFESENRVIKIILVNGEQKRFYGKLNDVEKTLQDINQRFLRVHQSFLVNYNYVMKMSFTSIVIDAGKAGEIQLQVSEDRQKKVRMQLGQMFGRWVK